MARRRLAAEWGRRQLVQVQAQFRVELARRLSRAKVLEQWQLGRARVWVWMRVKVERRYRLAMGQVQAAFRCLFLAWFQLG